MENLTGYMFTEDVFSFLLCLLRVHYSSHQEVVQIK